MQTSEVLYAWATILAGRVSPLSIEITKGCPLRTSDRFGKTFRKLRSAFSPKAVKQPEPAPFTILQS